MQLPHQMTSLVQVMEKLKAKGLDKEFRWTDKGFTIDNEAFFQPHELLIIKVYRFEEITNPSDMSVLYLIKASGNVIGYSLDAYGVYSNHDNEEGYDNFIRQIAEAGHDEQLLFTL
jgi:hypothetical protein